MTVIIPGRGTPDLGKLRGVVSSISHTAPPDWWIEAFEDSTPTPRGSISAEDREGDDYKHESPGFESGKPKARSMNTSLVARQAGLISFAQARNCGTGSGGFQTGNTCASGKLQDAAQGAAKGAVKGAAIGLGTTWTPAGAAQGAAVGAAFGAVKGLYDNSMRPTRVMKTIEKIGSSKEKVADLVKNLGGSPRSSANVTKGKLTLKIRDKDGKRIFDVSMNAKKVVITPARASGKLTKSEIKSVKAIAKEHSPREVDVVVKEKSPGYVASLVKAGFKVSADTAGTLVASFVAPFAAVQAAGLAGHVGIVAYEAVTKKKI